MSTKKKKLKKGSVSQVTKIMWRHSRHYWVTILFILVVIISLNAAQVITPIYYKKLVDVAGAAVVGAPVEKTLAELFGVFLVIAILKGLVWLFRRGRGFLLTYFESRIMTNLSQTAFNYLIQHSYRFFTDSFSGSLVRKVNRFTKAFEDIIDQLVFALLPLLFTLAGILWVLFLRNTILGVILTSGVIAFLGLHILAARWKQKYEIAKTEKDSEVTGSLADAISNSATIKLFTGYGHEMSLFRQASEGLHKIRLFTWNLNEGVDAGQGFLMAAIEVAMLYAAIVLWGRGILTVGDFVLIQVYLTTIFDRIGDFGRVLRRLFEAFADGAEMVEILNTPHEVRDVRNASQLVVKNGEIKFQKVDFSFHKTRKILDKFTLTIRPGEKVALVGSSGAGKSTITLLLSRFYDVDAGKILIDGQDISHVTQESLWDAIALVPQEPILFHRTLRENILYGRRDASDEEIIEAAKKAHCHEFISSLPLGYETYVGERGIKLSGGERQRAAIARAILKNAPLLVLDEATSSLDSESEALIQDALRQLMAGKTVIAIAHRLSTIRQMDRIIVIEDGKIAAMGTHEELLKQGGVYQKLWEIQAGKFLA